MPTEVNNIAALLVVLAGLRTGRHIREHARASTPAARHFPSLPSRLASNPALQPRHWFVAAAIDVAAVLALAIWNVSGLATLVIALCGTAVLAAMAWPIQQHARACARTNAAINAFAPRIAVPYAGTTLEHIDMWAPYIQRADRPWCIVADTTELLDELAARYDVPMVAGTFPVTVRAALYPLASSRNGVFLDNHDVRHVYVGHGDTDEPFTDAERNLDDYDLVTVAGQGAIDRFEAAGVKVTPEQLVVIGRPQLEGITRAATPISRIASPTVLYAPTWCHADDSLNLSSLVVGDKIVRALLDRGLTVVFRRHYGGRSHVASEMTIETIHALLEQDSRATGRQHVWGDASAEMPLVEAFNLCDAMISDVSSIVVDFMQSEKPFAMYASQVSSGPHLAAEFRAANPTAESAYVLDRDLFNLETVLHLMLGPDPLSPTRMDRTAHYLGDDRREPAKPFIKLITGLSG
ncbi:MAG: CDP-glycerol glycerophosphotransferase family protein [Aeromicrobium sp.]